MLDSEQQTTLNSLRWYWEQAYAVNCDGTTWTVIPAAAPETVLTAATGMELRTLMQHTPPAPCGPASPPPTGPADAAPRKRDS